MFGNLLGTLKEVQKETENGKGTTRDLANKRREIEKCLEEEDKHVYTRVFIDHRIGAEEAEQEAIRFMRERSIALPLAKMPVDLGTELDQAYQELRGIDSELATLGGRTGPLDRSNNSHRRVNVGAGQELSVGFDTSSGGAIGDRIARRRIAMDPNYENSGSAYGSTDRRVQEVGGRRRIVVSTNNNINNGDYDSARKRSHHDSENNSSSYQPPLKRTLQSSVVMPTIETKSRDATITEMKKTEKSGDAVRNRRMFSNLLVGTLRQFQREEDSTKKKTQTQFEKQREVERRLERTDKENKTKIYKEKEELISRRREKEQQILLLKRKKAIIQYAEEKQKHLRRLQHFIQTQTKPPLFFLPAKHTLRTLELLKDSSKKVENLIELRQQEMEKELRRDEESSDEEEERAGGLKSAIVPVTKSRNSTDEKDKNNRHVRNPKKEVLSEEGELDENGDEVEIGKVEEVEIGKVSPKEAETQPTEAEPQEQQQQKKEEEGAAEPVEPVASKPIEEEEAEEVDIPVDV